MANQPFYNGNYPAQQFPQSDYSNYQQPQYNPGGQQADSYAGSDQQQRGQYEADMRQDQYVSIHAFYILLESQIEDIRCRKSLDYWLCHSFSPD
jgi:hypothetical protein